MKLTEHFSLSEFERSATADRLHIDNTIPEELIPNLKNLCVQVLEPLREHFGTPVVISSGYRCPALNRAVGGASNSQHLTGEAADIIFPSTLNSQPSTLTDAFYWLIDNVPFDQLGFESKGTTKWIKPLRVFSSFAPRQFEQARLHSVWRRFTSAANQNPARTANASSGRLSKCSSLSRKLGLCSFCGYLGYSGYSIHQCQEGPLHHLEENNRNRR